MANHFDIAVDADLTARNTRGEDSERWHRTAQVHATLALAEQQRIANLIALTIEPEGADFDEMYHIRRAAWEALTLVHYSGPDGAHYEVQPDIARAMRFQRGQK